jgi:hypothetical protein
MRDRLSELASGLYHEISIMTPRERRAASRAIDRLTDTNCGWQVYELRHVLRDFIATATPKRRKKRKV